MSDIFADPPVIKKVMIVVDMRGDQYASMPAGEYAVRVAGEMPIREQDLVLLASPDTKSGTIVRGPTDFGGAIYTMEIVEAAGHAPPVTDEEGDEFVNLSDLLRAMSSEEDDASMKIILTTAAAWVAARYDHTLPETD